jgi:hypothetical protein
MFTSDLSIDEVIVVDLINDVILTDEPIRTDNQYDFLKKEDIDGVKIVSFRIEGLSTSQKANEICDAFKELEIFIDILIDNSSICTLKSLQEIDYLTVNRLVRASGASISIDYLIKSTK